MPAALLTATLNDMSARARARIGGVFYLLDLVTSVIGDTVLHGTPLGLAADRFATVCYVIVTVVLFSLLRVINMTLAIFMASFSLLALMTWTFGQLVWNGSATAAGNVIFGVYLVIAGFLIYRSTFMPRIVGAALAPGGLGLLTYVSPRLVGHIYPYNAIPALVGETSLMLWLVLVGINLQRWEARAGTPRVLSSPTPRR